MILIAVLQTMEEKAREVAKIPHHAQFWDVDETIKVFFRPSSGAIQSVALSNAGIAHNYALFLGDDENPAKRGKIRFEADGGCRVWPTVLEETEFGLWERHLTQYRQNLTILERQRMVWVLADQQPWDNQQHNGNMFLMRKMLTM